MFYLFGIFKNVTGLIGRQSLAERAISTDRICEQHTQTIDPEKNRH